MQAMLPESFPFSPFSYKIWYVELKKRRNIILQTDLSSGIADSYDQCEHTYVIVINFS